MTHDEILFMNPCTVLLIFRSLLLLFCCSGENYFYTYIYKYIVTNYHVIRNAKVAQIAIITRNKGGSGTLATLPPAQQASTMTDDDPISNVFTSSNTRARGIEGFSSEYQRSVYKATVVGVDPGKDIAVLKVEAPKEVLTPISVGTSTGLRVGQQALAIGNPFGLDHTLTVGVISGLGREVKSPVGRPITNVIQADCRYVSFFFVVYVCVYANFKVSLKGGR